MTNEELLDRELSDRSQSDKAFAKLVSGLRPLVEAKLKSKYNDKWERQVHRIGNNSANLNDPLCLLWTLNNNWQLFSNAFPHRRDAPTGKELVWDLKEYRNASAHLNPNFTTQDKEKAIDNIVKLLELVVPRTPAIEEAISRVSEIIKENLLKKMQALDSRIASVIPVLDATAVAVFQPTSALEPDPGTPPRVVSDIEKELLALEKIVSSKPLTVPKPPVPAPDQIVAESTPQTVQPTPENTGLTAEVQQLKEEATSKPVETSTPIEIGTKAELRVEIQPPTGSSKWWLLQIYDGGMLIGSYERSYTEEGANEKIPEVYCSATELRQAYKDNGNTPFVVRWNGTAIGKEGKRGVKQIKKDASNTGKILGEIPRDCFRKTK